MPGQRASSMREILTAVKARLVSLLATSANKIKSDQIFILARGDTPKYTAQTAIYLRPRGLRARRGDFRGGTRLATVVVRILDILIGIQHAGDATMQDDKFLDRIYAVEDAVLDVLQAWFPEGVADASGNTILTTTGLELLDDTDPRRLAGDRLNGDLVMSFEVQYQATLDTSWL